MAITFVGSTSGQEAANTTGITLWIPAHATDDFGIIYARADEAGTVPVLSIGASAVGWTLLVNENPTSGRDRVEYIWYKKFISGGEINPVVNIDIAQEHSASLHVFRNVDTVQPFDAIFQSNSGQNSSLPTNPAITSVTANSCLILLHGATHDDITVAGVPTTPTGITLGETILGGSNDHRGQIAAYKLDTGAAATITPTAWTHTASPTTTAEYSTFTLLLRNLQPIHLTDVDTDEKIQPSQVGAIATGDGFEAVQGTGKIELVENSDYTGTKVSQTVNSWGATSIDFDVVQGGLSEGVVYCFVTNDSGDLSAPLRVTLGFGPYRPEEALNPDHHWRMDNSYTDTGEQANRPFNNAQTGTPDFVATQICRSATYSFRINQGVESSELADSAYTNITNQHTRRRVGGWVQFDSYQLLPAAIYEEGGGLNNFYFILGYGNTLLANVADSNASPTFKIQAYSDRELIPGRPYYIMLAFEGNGYDNEFYLLVDGVKQMVTSGNPPAGPDMSTHSGDWSFGQPDGNLDTGGTDIAYNAASETLYSNWGTYSQVGGGIPTDAQIREDLFENGALYDDAITAGTEAAMQTALEVFDDTTRADWPCSFEIPPASGETELNLTATNIVFPDEISCHIRWTGSGTLYWRNSGSSNASIVSTPNGGTVTFIETASITLTALSLVDSSPISGARVLLEADGDGPLPSDDVVTITRSGSTATVTHTAHGLLSGSKIVIRGADQGEYLGVHSITVVNVNAYTYTVSDTPTTPATGTILATAVIASGTTDGSGQISSEIDYTADQPVRGVVRKVSGSPRYKTTPISTTIISAGTADTAFMVEDE